MEINKATPVTHREQSLQRDQGENTKMLASFLSLQFQSKKQRNTGAGSRLALPTFREAHLLALAEINLPKARYQLKIDLVKADVDISSSILGIEII